MRVLWMSSAFLLLHFLHSGFTAPVSDTDDQDSDDLAVDDDASSYAELSSTDFEGDMVGFLIIPGVEGQNTALSDENKRWKWGVIPYVVSDDYSLREIQMILDAFAIFEQKTCVRFVPRCTDPDAAKSPGCDGSDFINIVPQRGGCSSMVGRMGNGVQIVNLQKGTGKENGCFTKNEVGRIVHELMHALGFIHEHTRSDRDNYVTVKMDLIAPTAVNNFQKYAEAEITSFGEPYDYGSVMHYPRNSFAVDKVSPTIVPKDKTKKIGQRITLSEIDIRKVNKAYEKECPPRPQQ